MQQVVKRLKKKKRSAAPIVKLNFHQKKRWRAIAVKNQLKSSAPCVMNTSLMKKLWTILASSRRWKHRRALQALKEMNQAKERKLPRNLSAVPNVTKPSQMKKTWSSMWRFIWNSACTLGKIIASLGSQESPQKARVLSFTNLSAGLFWKIFKDNVSTKTSVPSCIQSSAKINVKRENAMTKNASFFM